MRSPKCVVSMIAALSAFRLSMPCCIVPATRRTFSRKPSPATTSRTALPTGHRERAAAEGGAMNALGHAGGGLGGCEDHPHREAAANALGGRQKIRLGALDPLVMEQLAGTARAALDLVIDEEHAVLVGQLAQGAAGNRGWLRARRPRPAPARSERRQGQASRSRL